MGIKWLNTFEVLDFQLNLNAQLDFFYLFVLKLPLNEKLYGTESYFHRLRLFSYKVNAVKEKEMPALEQTAHIS